MNECVHEKPNFIIFYVGQDPLPRVQCGSCGVDITKELRSIYNFNDSEWTSYVFGGSL